MSYLYNVAITYQRKKGSYENAQFVIIILVIFISHVGCQQLSSMLRCHISPQNVLHINWENLCSKCMTLYYVLNTVYHLSACVLTYTAHNINIFCFIPYPSCPRGQKDSAHWTGCHITGGISPSSTGWGDTCLFGENQTRPITASKAL